MLEVGGECDASTLDTLNQALRDAVAQQANEVVVDLAQATFVDSLTLGSLTAVAKQVRASGDCFSVIRACAPAVRRAFELTGLARYLLGAAS